MDSKRLEIKVGLFVLIGLVALAVLLIQFSKGTSVFHGTYTLRLHAANVGGLKQRASVLLAGVIVGDVSDIQLAPDGKSVTIILKIYKTVKIYGDAHFVIEQAGFLGDNFVAILPTDNKLPPWTDGADVDCEPPFDLQQVARSATGFIQRVDDTVKKIEDSVTKLQNTVLNDQTLSNLSLTVANLQTASGRAVSAVGDIDAVVATNGVQVSLAVSNLVAFSQQLNQLAVNAQEIIVTNGSAISGSVSNLEMTTAELKEIADETHAGKGMVGTLLENQQLADNLQTTVNNLTVASSNLNQLGLWHFLWHHEAVPPYTNAPATASGPPDENK
jgi:phospholipid/cholesterol/gamma-HCH transport system substrate-binding protein